MPEAVGSPSIGLDEYFRLPPALFREFNDWLRREGLLAEHLTWLRLLEGAIEAERYVTDADGRVVAHGSDLQRETRIYPITTAPPREALA